MVRHLEQGMKRAIDRDIGITWKDSWPWSEAILNMNQREWEGQGQNYVRHKLNYIIALIISISKVVCEG